LARHGTTEERCKKGTKTEKGKALDYPRNGKGRTLRVQGLFSLETAMADPLSFRFMDDSKSSAPGREGPVFFKTWVENPPG
jgi:hypothetical protein